MLYEKTIIQNGTAARRHVIDKKFNFNISNKSEIKHSKPCFASDFFVPLHCIQDASTIHLREGGSRGKRGRM